MRVYGFLVSKETVVLRRCIVSRLTMVGGRDENKNLVLSNEPTKAESPPRKV